MSVNCSQLSSDYLSSQFKCNNSSYGACWWTNTFHLAINRELNNEYVFCSFAVLFLTHESPLTTAVRHLAINMLFALVDAVKFSERTTIRADKSVKRTSVSC